jgi:hypothetical protein
MKKILFVLLILNTILSFSQVSKSNDLHFETCIKKWFAAWELVSKDVYKINTLKPTDFLLFDETYLYTTSAISGKDGNIIKGTKHLLGQKYVWLKKPHNGKITLPSGVEQDVNLMCFAGSDQKDKNAKTFFVMPLINYWIQNKIDDHKIGYDNLVTAVFVHEFSHSQQIDNTMNGMEDIFGNYFTAHPEDQFSDDLIEDIYKKDTLYTKDFDKELALFFKASESKTKSERIELGNQAIKMLEQRQEKILTKDNRDLSSIDNYWLTIEGTGQYSAFEWLIHKKGGNLPIDEALKGLKTSSWSQEEGFAIFYLYSKFQTPENWSKNMFRSKKVNIIELLKVALNGTN